MTTKLTQAAEKAAKKVSNELSSASDLFCEGAMKAGPACKTSRHKMAVWLAANIDDRDPWAVLA